MKARDVIIGIAFLILLVAGVMWFSKNKANDSVSPIPSPSITSRINEAFPNLDIPEGVERANLTDVSGGSSLGVATRTEIVANLPDLESGKNYQGWLEDNSGKTVLLGNFYKSKSGWILSYNSQKYSGYNKVVVTNGSVRILEGSF